MLSGVEVDAPTLVRVQQALREDSSTLERRRREGQGVSTGKDRDRGEPSFLLKLGGRPCVDFPLPPSHPRSVKEVCQTVGVSDGRCGDRERSIGLLSPELRR